MALRNRYFPLVHDTLEACRYPGSTPECLVPLHRSANKTAGASAPHICLMFVPLLIDNHEQRLIPSIRLVRSRTGQPAAKSGLYGDRFSLNSKSKPVGQGLSYLRNAF
jgi:hypothetical protein